MKLYLYIMTYPWMRRARTEKEASLSGFWTLAAFPLLNDDDDQVFDNIKILEYHNYRQHIVVTRKSDQARNQNLALSDSKQDQERRREVMAYQFMRRFDGKSSGEDDDDRWKGKSGEVRLTKPSSKLEWDTNQEFFWMLQRKVESQSAPHVAFTILPFFYNNLLCSWWWLTEQYCG